MLGHNLQEARRKSGYTQQDVSEKLYVTRQTISRWEQDKTLPNIHVLNELCLLYNMSLDELYAGVMPQVGDQNSMKRFNYFALFGVAFFNIFLFSGIAAVLVVSLLSVWLMTLVFALAPLILGIAITASAQPFDWPNAIFATIACPIGIFSIKYAVVLSRNMIAFFKKYYRFNLKMIKI